MSIPNLSRTWHTRKTLILHAQIWERFATRFKFTANLMHVKRRFYVPRHFLSPKEEGEKICTFPLVLTRANATAGKLSHASCVSSPGFPRRWPERILAAVRVLIPMPSPTKRTTPRATPAGGVVPLTLELAAVLIRASIARVAASYQTSFSAKN